MEKKRDYVDIILEYLRLGGPKIVENASLFSRNREDRIKNLENTLKILISLRNDLLIETTYSSSKEEISMTRYGEILPLIEQNVEEIKKAIEEEVKQYKKENPEEESDNIKRENAFLKKDEKWEITYNNKTDYFDDIIGMGIIQYLLMHPFEKVSNSDLIEHVKSKVSKNSKSNTDKERQNVRKLFSYALGKIYDKNDKLGRYLENKILTGKSCVYNPDRDNPIQWHFK